MAHTTMNQCDCLSSESSYRTTVVREKGVRTRFRRKRVLTPFCASPRRMTTPYQPALCYSDHNNLSPVTQGLHLNWLERRISRAEDRFKHHHIVLSSLASSGYHSMRCRGGLHRGLWGARNAGSPHPWWQNAERSLLPFGILIAREGRGCRWQVWLMFVPVATCGVFVPSERLPVHERIAAGVSYRDT
jgi:hypothetical protein